MMDSTCSITEFYASVKFSTIKNCFVIVPAKWAKEFCSDLLVCKILYGEHYEKAAYASCGPDKSHRKDVQWNVFMNQKFAEMLGLKEKDPVLLQPVLSPIPKAEKVLIEPLSSDDWEILEQNSNYIEGNLMNQIRIVWVGQIFPVWIQNYCFFKVVSCKPDHNPVILYENSEVSVVPKDRYLSDSLNEKDSQKCKTHHLQFQCLRNYSKPKEPCDVVDSDEASSNSLTSSEIQLPQAFNTVASFAQNITSYITSYITSSPKDEKSSLEEAESLSDIYPFNFDSVLRVLPYTNPTMSLPTVMQATTVFITESTYVSITGKTEVPPCFVGILEKYVLPGKKPKKGLNESTKNNLSDSSAAKNGDKSDDLRQKVFDSMCVTVMVMKCFDEDEFMLPSSLFTYKNAIVVPKELKRALSLEVGCLTHLKSVDSKPLSSFKIVLHPVTLLSNSISEKVVSDHFTLWAFGKNRQHHTFVISDGTLVKLKIHSRKYEFFVQLEEKETTAFLQDNTLNSVDSEKSNSLRNESAYALLTYNALKEISVKVGAEMCQTVYDERLFLIKETGMYCDIKSPKLNSLGGLTNLSMKAIEDIKFWLKLRPSSYISHHTSTYCGCILICGPKGVGKSSFANALCKTFASYPYHVIVKSVHCLSLKGNRVATIAKKWNDIVSEAIYSQPSLILLEDLDYIASAPLSHEQENGPDGIYFLSISQAFINMMHRVTSSESKVTVIVTAQSLHSLHPSLVNTKGRHIFHSILEITPPTVDQRAEILRALLCNKSHISRETVRKVNVMNVASKSDGFVAQDLNVLVDKATHAAWIRLGSSQESDQIVLMGEDFDVALKSTVPSSLRNMSLQMQDQKTWNDVGGLNEAKKVIQRIIMWPIKYKEILKNYSLKPQTNILLYGAPGTGKTLLAGVVANACGMNFISIKGPELLSKYIGASEQAVRDIFKRATTARPCILFFDEFDSIAPRRGHDSTGVTDRVVNQLLTQLDGVESLEGVHLLAATSRPDLIDPALLRPGRLDKRVHCPLPNKEERIEILHCLSSKLSLCDDVDFESIATLTEHFSGADLQALLYTAYIEALRDVQNTSSKHYSTSSEDSDYIRASDKLLSFPTLEEGSKKPSDEEGKKIVQEFAVVHDKYFVRNTRESRRRSTLNVSTNQRHLLKVASEMKPSVSFEERLRYETIFKDFQKVLLGDTSASVTKGNGKRVTLA